MWEHRCKVAVSGVGFSKVTRSAEVPLAAHALAAVKDAVADSGLSLSDIARPESSTAPLTASSACAASGTSAERVTRENPTPLTATLHRCSHM